MLLTHKEDRTINRPIAKHRGKPHLPLTIALMEMRIIELPANTLRKQVLEKMIERANHHVR